MDIDWNLVHKYLAGDCTDAERQRFEAWLAEAPMHRRIFHEIGELATGTDRMVTLERQEVLLADLKQRVAGAPPLRILPKTASTPSRRIRQVWRVAAMLVGAVGASIVGYRLLRYPSTPLALTQSSSRTFTTPRAGRLSLRLPDGTRVDLAPATTLRLLGNYGARERAVELVGEAVFTVTHDADRPFTVHTNRLVARDLGTRFVVREYPEDPAAEVVVAEGIVSVRRGSSAASHIADSIVLERGDRVRATGGDSLTVTRSVSLEGYFDWAQGRMVFRDASLGEAVARIERWYDIDIRLASAGIAELRLTASFEPADTAADALQVIADALDLQVTRDNRGYTLRAK